MEERIETVCDTRKPVYTRVWLFLRILFVVGVAFAATLLGLFVDDIASDRAHEKLLSNVDYSLVSESISYCFFVVAITLLSVMMTEIVFRKQINHLQYILIGLSLTLFYLLLLSLSEFVPFPLSYAIVCVMTIGLITLFIKGVTKTNKSVKLSLAILVVEYTIMFTLINIGETALLIGSLLMFMIIALAMYFTLKIGIVNDELTLK